MFLWHDVYVCVHRLENSMAAMTPLSDFKTEHVEESVFPKLPIVHLNLISQVCK